VAKLESGMGKSVMLVKYLGEGQEMYEKKAI